MIKPVYDYIKVVILIVLFLGVCLMDHKIDEASANSKKKNEISLF